MQAFTVDSSSIAVAYFAKGTVFSRTASGIAAGATLFLGASIIENVSDKLADTFLSKDSKLYATAKTVLNITLQAFAVFSVVNLMASTLAGSLITPFPIGGAVLAGVLFHTLNQAENVEPTYNFQRQEACLGPMDFAENEIGKVKNNGTHAVLNSSFEVPVEVEILSVREGNVSKVTAKTGPMFSIIEYPSGEQQQVVISKGIVYKMTVPDDI